MQEIERHKIGLIDMVVCNLYPFETVIQKKNISLEEALLNIDIGGPAMLRSAAKNFKSVAVICNLKRYEEILKELTTNNGLLSDAVLFTLAVDVFQYTAGYDGIISHFLNKRLRSEDFSQFPREVNLRFTKVQDLRYGENPHQRAAFYRDSEEERGLAQFKKLHGKELSFNNFLDLNAACECLKDFDKPAAAIIKHNNPTGLAVDDSLAKAYGDALRCDSLSAFGGIIGLNRAVDGATAKKISESGFMECVVAPGFSPEALECLTKKKNLRLIELDFKYLQNAGLDFKKVQGGVLLQERDEYQLTPDHLKVVTRKKPTKSQLHSMSFGWQVVKNIKSNAVILVKGTRAVGIGCGQTSRVDALRSAIFKAGPEAKGSVLISDAFLPMIDNIQLAAKAGITAVIQTGGSIADEEIIKAADKAGIAMVFTGVRHFRH